MLIQECEQKNKEGVMTEPITLLLQAWAQGDKSALDRAFPLFYEHVRSIAARQMRGENGNITLSTTILVSELYLELVATKQCSFVNRFQFYAFATSVIRHVLVRHARRRKADKRGGNFYIELFQDEHSHEGEYILEKEDLLALSQALDSLEKMDPRQARVVELSFFAGLTQAEIAEALEISRSTVKRDLRVAHMWLSAHLNSPRTAGDA